MSEQQNEGVQDGTEQPAVAVGSEETVVQGGTEQEVVEQVEQPREHHDAGDGELTPGETPAADPDFREPVLNPDTGLTDVQQAELDAAGGGDAEPSDG